MTRPIVSESGEQLYASLGPYRNADEANDWHLLLLCGAIADAFVEPVAALVSERNGMVPWEVLLSPADCPVAYLPWLAQWTGSTLSPDMSEAEMRAAITLPAGWRRGTLDALVQAVKRTLTGSQHVYIEERVGGSAYAMAIRTLTSETPVPTAVPRNVRRGMTDLTPTEEAIVSQKPIGNVCSYATVDGATYAEIEAEYTDYADLNASNPTYADIPVLPD